ncbi:MAG: hypothetical protein OXI96_06010 [Acidimicrobiaceae bacterium]|nr:hypothetical protein [Acidimicrobiaceae bacterium]
MSSVLLAVRLVDAAPVSVGRVDTAVMIWCMRTRVALEAEQHAMVKRKAAALGISIAEYIRRLIDRDLAVSENEPDISDIFGLGDSGGSDIAVDRKNATAQALVAHRSKR